LTAGLLPQWDNVAVALLLENGTSAIPPPPSRLLEFGLPNPFVVRGTPSLMRWKPNDSGTSKGKNRSRRHLRALLKSGTKRTYVQKNYTPSGRNMHVISQIPLQFAKYLTRYFFGSITTMNLFPLFNVALPS